MRVGRENGRRVVADPRRDDMHRDAGGEREESHRHRYDNLGLETVWKHCQTVLISDGGGQTPDDPDPPGDWPRQTIRVLKVIENQVRALRKRQAVGSYKLGIRSGSYWAIRSEVVDCGLGDALDALESLTRILAETPTRLKKLDSTHQERLINWGYVISDTALRRWVKPELRQPAGLPYVTGRFAMSPARAGDRRSFA